MTNTNIFARIIKQDKQPDGTLIVTGIATDNSLDSDDQICDPTWLKTAMPDWFRWGNIREQHSNIAAGVATEYETKGNEHWITAKVVDPASVKKVESGVLKGFSIGIRGPRVVKDNKAAGGRIVDGEIVEVSLVDRPANPICTLALAKSVDGVVTAVEELNEKAMDEMIDEPGEESTEETTETTVGEVTEDNAAPAAKSEMTDDGASPVGKGEPLAEESSQEIGEESSQELGEESSREGGVAGVAGKTLEDRLGMIEEMLTTLYDSHLKTEKAVARPDIEKSVKEMTERMLVLEKAASTGGPVRAAVGTPPAAIDENITRAQGYRAKAMTATDPRIAQGYLSLAHDLETLSA